VSQVQSRGKERRTIAAVSLSRWDEHLGPFYSARQVARLLGGISRQAVAGRRERGTLLGLKTADGRVVYPTFQFGEANRLIPGLAEVIRCFRRSEVEAWILASWLVSPLRSLEGQSVLEWLRSGKDLQPLLVLARDAARRFAQ